MGESSAAEPFAGWSNGARPERPASSFGVVQVSHGVRRRITAVQPVTARAAGPPKDAGRRGQEDGRQQPGFWTVKVDIDQALRRGTQQHADTRPVAEMPGQIILGQPQVLPLLHGWVLFPQLLGDDLPVLTGVEPSGIKHRRHRVGFAHGHRRPRRDGIGEADRSMTGRPFTNSGTTPSPGRSGASFRLRRGDLGCPGVVSRSMSRGEKRPRSISIWLYTSVRSFTGAPVKSSAHKPRPRRPSRQPMHSNPPSGCMPAAYQSWSCTM